MPRIRAAFDVDLNRIHGYSERDGRICYNAEEWPWDAVEGHDMILVEIASPVNTSSGSIAKKKAQEYNRRKWAISNSLQIGRLMLWMEQQDILDRLLVSPANLWTLGHEEAIREAVAGCVGEDNHDIRACRCMLAYHLTNPTKWRPIRAYLASLEKKKRKRS